MTFGKSTAGATSISTVAPVITHGSSASFFNIFGHSLWVQVFPSTDELAWTVEFPWTARHGMPSEHRSERKSQSSHSCNAWRTRGARYFLTRRRTIFNYLLMKKALRIAYFWIESACRPIFCAFEAATPCQPLSQTNHLNGGERRAALGRHCEFARRESSRSSSTPAQSLSIASSASHSGRSIRQRWLDRMSA